MEGILHQLIGSLSHYLQGFIHSRWCRISSINSITSKRVFQMPSRIMFLRWFLKFFSQVWVTKISATNLFERLTTPRFQSIISSQGLPETFLSTKSTSCPSSALTGWLSERDQRLILQTSDGSDYRGWFGFSASLRICTSEIKNGLKKNYIQIIWSWDASFSASEW